MEHKKRVSPHVRKLAWEHVDWTKSDIDLAAEMGVSKQRVHQKRHELGKPRATRPSAYQVRLQQKDSQIEACYREFKATERGRTIGVSSSEVAQALGLEKELVRRTLAKLNLETTNHKTLVGKPFHLVNWSLPNILLADIWGWQVHYIAQRRCTLKKPKPKWAFYNGKRPVSDELDQAEREQRRVAEEWRLSTQDQE